MTQFTRIQDRFSYHTEDVNCVDCLYHKRKSERKNKETGCGEQSCRFEDIRREALENGRIKRPRGYFKCRE